MALGRYLAVAASLPVRGTGFGLGLAAYSGAVAADLVASGVRMAADVAADVGAGALGGVPVRRSCSGDGRAWIEVRGLDGPRGDEVAARVLEKVRALDGVRTAELNRPLSRVVVSVVDGAPSAAALLAVVAEAETAARQVSPSNSRDHATDIPGDDLVLAERAVALAAATTGFAVAAAMRVVRMPRLQGSALAAAVTVVNYQPRLRKKVEDRLGPGTAELVLATAQSVGDVVRQAPATLAVDVVLRTLLTAETWTSRRAWKRLEPLLAAHPADGGPRGARSSELPIGPVERHADRAALTQLVGASVVGAVTRSVTGAETAALVAAPKAARTAREAFAATLSRGLADAHGVLTLRPGALRCLDRVDTVVFDPAVLQTRELRVSCIRDVREAHRARVWEVSRAAVEAGALAPGWHSVSDLPGDIAVTVEDVDGAVLVSPTHHPLAAAVLAEARSAGVEVVSLDTETLGSQRSAFDDLHPAGGDPDTDLRDAVVRLQNEGRTVAVVAARAPQASTAADVGIGVLTEGAPVPWGAHLLADDLAAVWRVLRALPHARTASRRGVEIATAGSILGSLVMLPGVRGRGPGPVTAGAAAGLWTGHALARKVLRASDPTAAPVHAWHEMSEAQVLALLPVPEDDVIAGRRRSESLVPTSLAAAGRITSVPWTMAWNFGRAMRAELSDPLTPILATGSAASALLGSPVDAVLVGSVVTANAALSAVQRLHAERLLNRLLAVGDAPAKRVVGSGEGAAVRKVDAATLRPGHVIEIGPGEVVPADGRLIEAAGVEVDESSLTGESFPVVKHTDPTPGAPLGERACMVFEGCTILTGTAKAVVTAVGEATESGRAGALTPASTHQVGLQAQLRALTGRVLPVSVGGGALVTTVGFLRGTGLRQAVTSGVAVAVAAVPEGLPLVATLAQQAAARRLARSNVLVRAPRSVEALGRVDVVCFDKTGTLSENRLRVTTSAPYGAFSTNEVLICAARSAVPPDGRPAEHATDVAIAGAARDLDHGDRADMSYLPFRSGRPFSAALSGTRLCLKGAPEVVLAACTNIAADEVHRTVLEMAADGLRVIAVAHRTVTSFQARRAADDGAAFEKLCSSELHFVGLLGLADTPRQEAKNLLPELAKQQVGVRLITGDHPVTARAITRELGLPVSSEQVITGSDWETLSHRGQEHAVDKCVV
ncbi:MAG: HAD-IC family P-type ATPase, partial [Rhodococcus sp. (in: high G+C Gram-positive bacteria)]|uniref:HAD-IC family P-type ATPase n=1 Tax=Rhodococcus sp. TaxID=1831 RepID=UPI003BAE9E2C